MKRVVAAAVLLLLCLSLPDTPLRAAEVSLEELPVPTFAGNAGVSNVAADGTVVGAGWGAMVVRWRLGQPAENLGGDTYTLENILPLISADGATIVASVLVPAGPDFPDGSLLEKASIWQGGTTWTPLADTLLEQNTPYGISDNGQHIVGDGAGGDVPEPEVFKAWQWSVTGGQQFLDAVDGLLYPRALAVSNDGRIVAGYAEEVISEFGRIRHAVRWDDGVAQRLTDAEDRPLGQVIACNSDCSIIVGSGFTGADGSSQAWRWTAEEGIRYLGELPGVPAGVAYHAFDTTEDGAMIVGAYPLVNAEDDSLMNHGFVWTQADGLVDIVDYLAAHGIDYGVGFNELVVNSITRDGQFLLLNGGGQDYQRQRALVRIVAPPEAVFADGFEAVAQ